MALAETIKGDYYYGTGRRKTAVARVRVFPSGDGSITVNGKNAGSTGYAIVFDDIILTPQ